MLATEPVVAALARRGAGEVAHPGGTLLAHLIRTSEILRSWDMPGELIYAGLAHAAYGTDGFPAGLFDVNERDVVRELIGGDAEAIVYRYGSCTRGISWPSIGIDSPVPFRDRFTGADEVIDDREVRDLALLTVANELDLAGNAESFRRDHGPALWDLFSGWADVVGPTAWAALSRVLGPDAVVASDRQVIVDGLRLHCLEWGPPSAPCVVFLHGGALHAHTWDLVCEGLAQDFRSLALDLRGHGDSEWSPVCDYAVATHARDVVGFLEATGVDRPVLVGHSLGGHAALHIATSEDVPLAGLVVVDTSPFVGHGPMLSRIRQFMERRSEFASLDDAVDYATDMGAGRNPTKARASMLRALRLLPDGRWTWRHDRRGLDDTFYDSHIEAVRGLLLQIARISCPTLLLRGERGAVSAADAERFCALLRDGRFSTVEAAGHNVHSEDPAGLLAALRPFLEATRRDAPSADEAAGASASEGLA